MKGSIVYIALTVFLAGLAPARLAQGQPDPRRPRVSTPLSTSRKTSTTSRKRTPRSRLLSWKPISSNSTRIS